MAARMTPAQRETLRVGRQYLDAGDPDAALHAFEGLLASCDRFADVHYMLGLALERQGRLDVAAESLERALALNPSYAECALALASVYEQRGLFDRAYEVARRTQERAGSLGPLDATTRGKLANLHAALGDAYREAGELPEAIEAYRKALDRAPGYLDIRFRLGVTLREAGLPGQAIAELRRVFRGNPSYLEAAVQLGLTYFSMGRTDQAVREWTAVLERDPSRDDARMYLRMVRRGDAPIGTSDPAEG
jgi:tetratricopeptide (TPR) repeat protein